MRTDKLFDRQERSDQPKPVPQKEDNMEEQCRDTCGQIWASRKMQLHRNQFSAVGKVGANHLQTPLHTQKDVPHSDQSENARTTIYIIQQKDMRATDLRSLTSWRGTSCALPAYLLGNRSRKNRKSQS